MTSLTTHSLTQLLRRSRRPEGVLQRLEVLLQLTPTLPMEEQRVVIRCVQELKDLRRQHIAIRALAPRVLEELRPLLVDLALQRAWPARSDEGDEALRSVRSFLTPTRS